MAKGGKRPGAGRKKGSKSRATVEQELALEFLREKVREKWGELIETKIELAKGIWAEKIIIKGKKSRIVRIYQKQPDSSSLEYLFSMVVGKPKERVEMEHKGKLPFNIIIQKSDGRKDRGEDS